MSALQKSALKNKLGGLPPQIPNPAARYAAKRGFNKKREYTLLAWEKYFDRLHNVKIDENNIFHVYESGSEGPVLLFLHGGGYSGLSWAVLSSILSKLVECRCTALDLRGHGGTVTGDDADLSADTLSSDIGKVIDKLYGENPPPIILIGHSMGGAIAVHTAHAGLVPTLSGLIVIDVVEGTAMDSLSSMQSFLRGRPSVFNSIEHAIEWCVKSGQIRNLESARVSMAGQVKRLEADEAHQSPNDSHTPEDSGGGGGTAIIEEEEEEETTPSDLTDNGVPDNDDQQKDTSTQKYTWRVDLSKSEQYWPGWFHGLSNLFLSCTGPKMLMLAGVDRLDRDLTIGQMQGKFQMQVLPQCGHAVHEDVPDKVADVLATFLVRHKLGKPTANFQHTFPAC